MSDRRDIPSLLATRQNYQLDWATLQSAVEVREGYSELARLIAAERALDTSLDMPGPPDVDPDMAVNEEAAAAEAPDTGNISPAHLVTFGDLLHQRCEVARVRIADRREAIALFTAGQTALDAGDFDQAVAALSAASSRAPGSRLIDSEVSRCTGALNDARREINGEEAALQDSDHGLVRALACAMAQARSLIARGEGHRAIGRLRDFATEFPNLTALQTELDRVRREVGNTPFESAGDPVSQLDTVIMPAALDPVPVLPAAEADQAQPRSGTRVVLRWPESPAGRGSRNLITVIFAGATGLALLTSPVWLPALVSRNSAPQTAQPATDPRRVADSDALGMRGTMQSRSTSLMGELPASGAAWQMPSQSLDFVGALEEARTFRDAEGRFQFDYPGWDWTVSPGAEPAVVVVEKPDGASIRIEHDLTSTPDLSSAALIDEESRLVFEREPQADRLTLRVPRPASPLIVLDYRRPTDSGWEQVRQYSRIEGQEIFRLVASAPADSFTLVEGVFNLVARSFTPRPDRSH